MCLRTKVLTLAALKLFRESFGSACGNFDGLVNPLRSPKHHLLDKLLFLA